MLFEQGELPLVDTEGKILIGKDFKIKEASDGNGGVFSSLRKTGMLSDMKEREIKWVFIGGVDNAILKMADTTLLGMAIERNVQIASKSVVKANPHEKVGVFCKMNGHPKVIEYSELPEKDQVEEVELKLRSLIRALRLINHEDVLDLPDAEFEKKGLSTIFYLIYCVEDEIAKILDK